MNEFLAKLFLILVIDGDTIQYRGETYRLVDYNTPEIRGAQCGYEKQLGYAAKIRLQSLVDQGIWLQEVPCAGPNYGRKCARAFTAQGEVSSILIGEALAEPYVCSKSRCPRRKQWCK